MSQINNPENLVMSDIVAARSVVSTTQFLRMLAGDYKLAEYAISHPETNGETNWFKLDGMYTPEQIDQITGHPDKYLKINPMVDPRTTDKKSIGKDEHLTAITCMAFDLDVDEKAVKYPSAAIWWSILNESPLKFGIVVESGSGGLHVYMLIDQNVLGERRRYDRAYKALWQYLQGRLDALRSGYTLDTSSTPTRLLRLPGSIHGKSGKTVTVAKASGERYSLDQLEMALNLGPIEDEPERVPYVAKARTQEDQWLIDKITEEGYATVYDVFERLGGYEIDFDRERVTRPGTTSGCPTGKFFTQADGTEGITINSSGAAPFEQDKWYSRESAYVVLKYGLSNDDWITAKYDAENFFTDPADNFDPLPPVETSFDIAGAAGQTDTANAARFADLHDRQVLFVPPWGKWLSWDGSRWADDSGTGVQQRAVRYAVSLWDCLPTMSLRLSRNEFNALVAFIRSTNQSPRIASFLKLAQSRENLVCPVEELNSDPMLLNVVNGTIDLSTGKLRPHNPADRLTQVTKVAYDSEAKCPKWEETLRLIFDGDLELIGYVQRLLGYSLSGSTGEHILPIAYGKGNNGKSTVWNTIAELLGDYASLANEELLLGDKSNHPTERAALYQKRFVAVSEPAQGAKLKESRVKELTGDRLITARRMGEDFWSFERTHTFWLSSNHLPRVSGTDEGIWRRIKLIPFVVNLKDKVKPIPDFDKWLVKHEGRGILAWLVRGFLDYQKNGLVEPACVTAAVQKYQAESDVLGDFLAEHTVAEDGAQALASDLYGKYVEWGGKWSTTAFGNEMGERFEKTKSRLRDATRGKTVYRGLRLRLGTEFD